MSNRDISQFKIGRLVHVRRDDGTIEERAIKYEPWQLGHGEWVVGLKGIVGGYLLERCSPIEEGDNR